MEKLPEAQSPNRFRWATRAWLAALYLAGALLWGYFLNWGRIPLNYHDWADISGPRLTFLKDAITKGELPLHISDTATLDGVTDRFLSIPDQILSPQVVLLRFLTVGQFVLVDVLFLYSLGFLGLLWLRRRFALSPAPFIVLFALLISTATSWRTSPPVTPPGVDISSSPGSPPWSFSCWTENTAGVGLRKSPCCCSPSSCRAPSTSSCGRCSSWPSWQSPGAAIS